MKVEPATNMDWDWIDANADVLGGPRVVSHGVLHTLREHPGSIAWADDIRVGCAVYRAIDEAEAELLALFATTQWHGVGTALLSSIEDRLRDAGVKTLWLCTTNDNLSALQFYQKRGYRLTALQPDAFREIQKIKDLAQEDVVGQHGIVIRDELTLAKNL